MKTVEGRWRPSTSFFRHRDVAVTATNTAFTVWAVDLQKVTFAMNRAKHRTNPV